MTETVAVSKVNSIKHSVDWISISIWRIMVSMFTKSGLCKIPLNRIEGSWLLTIISGYFLKRILP